VKVLKEEAKREAMQQQKQLQQAKGSPPAA
jgi:hypothetical protein